MKTRVYLRFHAKIDPLLEIPRPRNCRNVIVLGVETKEASSNSRDV